MRLAAGLRPDPLGELERSPRPPSRNLGVPTSNGEGKGRGKGRKGMGRGREEGKGKGRREGEAREERGGEGSSLLFTVFLISETAMRMRVWRGVGLGHFFRTFPSGHLSL